MFRPLTIAGMLIGAFAAAGGAKVVFAADTPSVAAPQGQTTTPDAKPVPSKQEKETGVVHPPDIDPEIAKPVPDVDPKMAKATPKLGPPPEKAAPDKLVAPDKPPDTPPR